MAGKTNTSNKWLSADMLFVYGIAGIILSMFEALGSLVTVLVWVSSLSVLAGLILLIKNTTQHKGSIKGWILLVVYVVIFFVSANVSFV